MGVFLFSIVITTVIVMAAQFTAYSNYQREQRQRQKCGIDRIYSAGSIRMAA
ncbi:MAG TPA: hypothetical protein VIU40_12960 [Geobacteraceae bacterium]